MPTLTSSAVANQIRNMGFTKLSVERPFGEPGVFIAGEKTELICKFYPEGEKYTRVFAQAPRLLALLEQARAALPDAWAAEKCGVPRELIEEMSLAIADAKLPA